MKKDPEYKTHPAYGVAVFNRQTAMGFGHRLFGSPLPDHHTSIALVIERASIRHDLGRDWIHGGSEELIRVTFSPAQFADLLTSMNVGGGVPCTIERVCGERMPDLPDDEPVEHEKVSAAFKDDVKETADRLRDGLKKLKTQLAKPKLSKEDKREIEWLVGKALQDVESNGPFMVEQFGQAATRIVSHARAEMAAVTQATVERLGLKKLDELTAHAREAEKLPPKEKP